jgi:hypothetical protein
MFRRKKDNEDDSHPLAPEPPQMATEPRVAMRQSPSAPGQVVAPAMTPRAAARGRGLAARPMPRPRS